MDIKGLIKSRYTIRKYKDVPVPEHVINEIIEAGRWASSVHGFQPWRFIVITNDLLKMEISDILIGKSKTIGSGLEKLLLLTAKTIANAPAIILVYNQNVFKDVAYKFHKISNEKVEKRYINIAELTEIEAISGAIQNMILSAHELGVGSCWNTIPLFCDKEINGVLKTDEQLIAVLSMGYPAEDGRRSKRKSADKTVKYKD
ncbi:NADH dehydrogenase [bacterium BMS3Abin15]|nr:NADH dehydrogenase [bacterium BMS3Abin15]